MSRHIWSGLRMVGLGAVVWNTGALCQQLGTNRATCARIVLLKQMPFQVVGNAITYSRPITPIRMSGARVSEDVALIVRNERPQIPEGERERIFEKFYRGSKDRSSVEGTGSGLVIARTIVESYGGGPRILFRASSGSQREVM